MKLRLREIIGYLDIPWRIVSGLIAALCAIAAWLLEDLTGLPWVVFFFVIFFVVFAAIGFWWAYREMKKG